MVFSPSLLGLFSLADHALVPLVNPCLHYLTDALDILEDAQETFEEIVFLENVGQKAEIEAALLLRPALHRRGSLSPHNHRTGRRNSRQGSRYDIGRVR